MRIHAHEQALLACPLVDSLYAIISVQLWGIVALSHRRNLDWCIYAESAVQPTCLAPSISFKSPPMPPPVSPPPLVFSPPPPSASISISMVNAADRRLLTNVASNLANSQPSIKPQAVQVKVPTGQTVTFDAATPLSVQQAILLPANMTTSILGVRVSVAGSAVYALLARWRFAA